MFSLLLRKFSRALVVLVSVTLLVFLLMHAIPGNPWTNDATPMRRLLGAEVDQALQAALSRHFGLDLPLWRQFTRYLIGDIEPTGEWVCGALCGNLGPSIQQRGRTVQAVLFEPPEGKTFWESRFGYSLRMVLLGALIAVGVGVPLGTVSALRPGGVGSRLISVSLAVLVSIPNFVLGLLAVIVLASWLHLLKVLPDWNDATNWLVPAGVLAVVPLASIARVTHATLLNLLGEDYVRTARAKGLSQTRALVFHVLRNALVPILTFVGPTVMELFTGLLIVENLYAFPGFGRQYWVAVLALDYPMILGLTLLYAVGTLLVNLFVEAGCEALDPRLRAAARPEAP